MKTASSSSTKWAQRAANAGQAYLTGAQDTTKDQATAAIAAKANWKAGIDAAVANDSFAKGLGRSGKAGWLAGVQQKGSANYATGVGTQLARSKYEANSGKYDTARGAASSITRGPKGSAGNLQRVSAVVTALRTVKAGR